MAFMDRRDRVTSPFLAISTENGDVIHLTETHHIYTHKLITSHESEATRQHYNSTSHETHDENVFDFSRSSVVFAKDIVIGDMVYVTNSHTGDIHSMSGAVHDVTDTTSDDVTDKNDDVPHKNNDVRHKSAVVHKNNDAMRKNDDILRINHGATGTFNDVKLSRVVGVWRSRGRGIYAPLTDTGTIVVDGVLVSCYALVSDVHIPHNALAPYRVMYQLTRYILPTTLRSMFTGDDTQNGVHWYAKTLYNLGTWVMPKGSLAVQGR
uniref:Hedgehog n=1 Tax=Wirenia argentea TaxID=669229 RepID=A0A1J0M5N5_9MOLL|nr:hedgehog [Wirenia argentea]